MGTKQNFAELGLPRFLGIVQLSCLATEFFNCLIGSKYSTPPVVSQKLEHIKSYKVSRCSMMADEQLMGVDLSTENFGSAVGLRLKCREALNRIAQIESYYYSDLQENVRQSLR